MVPLLNLWSWLNPDPNDPGVHFNIECLTKDYDGAIAEYGLAAGTTLKTRATRMLSLRPKT